MKKINILIVIIFIILGLIIFSNTNKRENVIKSITYNQIEDENSPLNYKKEYTLIISKLSNKNNSLEFNAKNHYVEVFVDNKLIYELKSKEKDIINISLKKDYINKKIKIILIPIDKDKINNDLNLEIK